MPAEIPASHKDLMDRPIVVTLATTMPDGTPQATPVWFDYVDGYIRINTARGRQKDANMENRPNVSVLSVDPDNPYRYLEVRGKIVEDTEEGAVEHIELLSRRYTGNPYFTDKNPQGSQVRVMYKIEPTRVLTRG
jgi:PPOX class probable F420-dependent enzyme